MGDFARQTLARYAFFEDARKSSSYSEDALIPLVLPSIAGRANTVFSAPELAKDLAPLFGDGLVLNLAESLVDPLVRHGYLRREVSLEAGGAIYIYTEKADDIPLGASISRAEEDLAEVLESLDDFIRVSRSIKPVVETGSELRERFIDWITTVESSDLIEGASRSTATPQRPQGKADQGVSDQLRLVFSTFVSWLSREREAVFEKVLTFAELGLLIDLVSELRVPSKTARKVSLTVVLDSRILLELLGLYGPASQASTERLLELCKTYGVTVVTLVHLVDEVKSITFNVLNSPHESFPGSVNEAIRLHPGILDQVKRVHQKPDDLVRKAGVAIHPYTQTSNINAERMFTEKNIREFTDKLPYDKSKAMMAKRDAWSLAYAVRRQNGAHTSNIYDSRCVILTRSFPFVACARTYLRSDAVGYPSYAVTPVIELRHFSTLFMLSFGSEVTRKVIRAELVASCDRIVRVSPDLTQRIRRVLGKMEALPEAQLQAAMEDPATLAEFALVTGNDPSVVTTQNSAALLEAMRGAGAKDEELRHRAAERELEERNAQALAEKAQALEAKEHELETMRRELKKHAEESALTVSQLAQQTDLNADMVVIRIQDAVRRRWYVIVALGVLSSATMIADSNLHFTGAGSPTAMAGGVALALVSLFLAIVPFFPVLEPQRVRRWFMRRIADRELKRYAQPALQAKVRAKLGLLP